MITSSILLMCAFLTFYPTYGEIVVRIESAADLAKYGFVCEEFGAEINGCQIKTVASAADLPAYFPTSFRNLSGKNFMYAETSNTSASGYFSLNSYKLPIHSGTFVLLKIEYYTETPTTIICGILEAEPYPPIGILLASSNSEWKNGFANYILRTTKEESEVIYSITNNRTTDFTVFRAIEIVIDPEPQINISITNLDEFSSSGVVCTNCTVGSVPSPKELPFYFPEGFRQLPSTENDSIMFFDVQNKDFQTLIMADLSNAPNLGCTGYVQFTPEFYHESVGSFDWGRSYWGWSSYEISEPSTWSSDTESFFQLAFYLNEGNRLIGFRAMNDGLNKMVVFRKLVVKIFYYPQPSGRCHNNETISFENTPFADALSHSIRQHHATK